MTAHPHCLSISCGNSAARPRYRWHPRRFTPNQPQPVVAFIVIMSLRFLTHLSLQTLVRRLINDLCHWPVHLIAHHRHGTPRPTVYTWHRHVSQIFFPRSLTRENGYIPRLASTTSAVQTHLHAYLTPELAQSPTPMHSTSLHDSPKSSLHDRASSPSLPPFSGHAYTRSGSDIPIELARPPELSRRSTLPGPILHPFVRHYLFSIICSGF